MLSKFILFCIAIFNIGMIPVALSKDTLPKYYQYNNIQNTVKFDKNFQDQLLSKKQHKKSIKGKKTKPITSPSKSPKSQISKVSSTKNKKKISHVRTSLHKTHKAHKIHKTTVSSIQPRTHVSKKNRVSSKFLWFLQFNNFLFEQVPNKKYYDGGSLELGIPFVMSHTALSLFLNVVTKLYIPTKTNKGKGNIEETLYNFSFLPSYWGERWIVSPYLRTTIVDSYQNHISYVMMYPGASYWYKLWNIDVNYIIPIHTRYAKKAFYASTGLASFRFGVHAVGFIQNKTTMGYGFTASWKWNVGKYTSIPFQSFYVAFHNYSVIGLGVSLRFQTLISHHTYNMKRHILYPPVLFFVENIKNH